MEGQKEERRGKELIITCTAKDVIIDEWHYSIIDVFVHRFFIRIMITGQCAKKT